MSALPSSSDPARISRREIAFAFLRLGVFAFGGPAAHIALMAVVGFHFARSTFVSIPAVVLGIVAGVFVFRFRINSAWAILGGGVAGIALRLFHLA